MKRNKMRAEIIHVTDHALVRWKQRVSKKADIDEIILSVKNSKTIDKKELLPYSIPRRDGSVYSFNAGILFILESVTINEYRLITVMSDKIQKNNYEKDNYEYDFSVLNKLPSFENSAKEREFLIEEKRKIESRLSITEKTSNKRKQLIAAKEIVEERLFKNKSLCTKEKEKENDYNLNLLQILKELKALRFENQELKKLIENQTR